MSAGTQEPSSVRQERMTKNQGFLVFKYKTYYYSGMARSTEQGQLPLKRSLVPKEDHGMRHRCPGAASGWLRRQRGRGNGDRGSYCGFCWKEQMRQSEQTEDWLA